MEAARPAQVEDLPRLAELAEAGLAELSRHRGAELLLSRRSGGEPQDVISSWMQDPSRSVWVGTVEAAVVGLAVGRAPGGPGAVGEVEVIYVEPEARGIGVGEALLERLVGWFTDRGCTGVDAVALPGVRDAKQFFEESGLVARLIVMHRRLP